MHCGSVSGGVAKISQDGAYDSCSIATQIWGRLQGSSLTRHVLCNNSGLVSLFVRHFLLQSSRDVIEDIYLNGCDL